MRCLKFSSSCIVGKPAFAAAWTLKYEVKASDSTLHMSEIWQCNANIHRYRHGIFDWLQLGKSIASESAQVEVDREL